jgi:hypothetical protein
LPFIAEVAAGAVDILTRPIVSETPTEILCKRFPKQHTLLISEHIAYASMLIQACHDKAEMLRAGVFSREKAINALTSSFTGFPVAAIKKALDSAISLGASAQP